MRRRRRTRINRTLIPFEHQHIIDIDSWTFTFEVRGVHQRRTSSAYTRTFQPFIRRRSRKSPNWTRPQRHGVHSQANQIGRFIIGCYKLKNPRCRHLANEVNKNSNRKKQKKMAIASKRYHCTCVPCWIIEPYRQFDGTVYIFFIVSLLLAVLLLLSPLHNVLRQGHCVSRAKRPFMPKWFYG